MKWWKKALFSAITVVSFFAVVELVLWGAGVEPLSSARDPYEGFSRSARVFEREASGEWFRTTPRAVRHSFNPQRFWATKPANGFRVFVLGGSSSYGFPWGAKVAFARWLGDALSASWPGRTIEVVNASGMSYGFQRLRILTHEVLDYDPDVLVYYEGHNEFVERQLFARLLQRTGRLQGVQALLFRSRLFSALARLRERLQPTTRERAAEGKTVGELLGFDVAREDAAQMGAAEKVAATAVLGENLRAILDLAAARHVPVVFCTVPSNLRDWAPNQSLFGPEVAPAQRDVVTGLLVQAKAALAKGAAAEAAAALEQARNAAPGYAETHFLLGRAYEALERWDDARASYIKARDLDAQPARALSVFNATFRQLAGSRRVALVDLEKDFEEASPHGLVGFNLIEDYVHPNRRGHQLIALALWRFLNSAGWLGAARSADPAEFWKALGAEGSAPAGAPPTGEAQASTPAELYNLGLVMDKQGEKARAAALYQQCLDLDPRYYAAALNLGLVREEGGDLAGAVRAFRQAVAAEPRRPEALVELGIALWRLEQMPDAEAALRRAVVVDPKSPKAWDTLGMVLAFQERSAEATEMFRKAVALAPNNYVAQANLGSALLLAGRAAEAVPSFRAALRVKHDFPPARDGLADALAVTGELDEAAQLYRASLAADPRDVRAAKGLEALQRRRAVPNAPR